MKIFALSLLLIFSALGSAEENFTVYLVCEPNSANCIEMPSSPPEQKYFVKKDPAMAIGQAEITDARIFEGEYGQKELSLTLSEQCAQKFEQLTEENIGKQLAIVAGGKVLIAPVIQSAIKGGRVQISGARGLGFLNDLPWLKEMVESKNVAEKRRNLLIMLSYLFCGVLFLGGTVYFAFFRGKKAVA